MDNWYILQIILDIYLCGFVLYYILAYRKKEYSVIKKQHLKEETETKKINDTLKEFLKETEVASLDMIEAFKGEHHAIKQSINYLNMKMEELNNAATNSKKLLNTIKEEIPNNEIRKKQDKLKYKEAGSLLSKGFAPAVVAKKMDMPIGEVKLINRLHMSAKQSQMGV